MYNTMTKYMDPWDTYWRVSYVKSHSIYVQMNSVEYTTLGNNELVRICVKHI
jgi:hypothetical protein